MQNPTHTHRPIRNTCCLSTTTTVPRTRLSVALYVHCLSCCKKAQTLCAAATVTDNKPRLRFATPHFPSNALQTRLAFSVSYCVQIARSMAVTNCRTQNLLSRGSHFHSWCHLPSDRCNNIQLIRNKALVVSVSRGLAVKFQLHRVYILDHFKVVKCVRAKPVLLTAWDSSVGIATHYGPNGPRIEPR